MGLSPSKRVTETLSSSQTFNTTCDTVYSEELSLSQHAFSGIPPYQLTTSANKLHESLSISLPLVSRWLPSPPSSSQVHSAYVSVLSPEEKVQDEQPCLGRDKFGKFAVRLFSGAVLENAGKTVMVRVPLGVAGIGGIGAVTRSGKDLVGAALGLYALGVAVSVYLGLA